MAGALPAPAQDAVANMAGHLGLELPHADEHPPATTHGAEVSDLARSTTAEGCAKGQAIAAAASVKAAAHRQNPTEKADPCAKTSPGDAGSKRPGRASGAGSRATTEQGARGAGRGAGPEPPGLEHRAPGRSGDQP